MVAVHTISWEEASAPDFGQDSRQAFRAAVDQVAARAKAALPECNGRVEKAVQIVLAGDVELLADGHAKVASQCQGTVVYRIVNGTCDCPDFVRAPASWCKHRIAAGLYKRASALVKQQRALPGAAQEPAPAQPSLPEAPASANCHITIAGRQVQVTLRDTDETRLLARLTTLLAQYPVEQASTDTPTASRVSTGQPEGWCQVHSVAMKRNTKEGRSWFSHPAPEGGWCKGKPQGQGR